MAKDREREREKDRDKDRDRDKLFRGVDDKAITFQRAVFIVCNLKRLIRRPKKDDKDWNAGGAYSKPRKRSGTQQGGGGGGGGGGDGSSDGAEQSAPARPRGQRNLRGRRLLRRALSLPGSLGRRLSLGAAQIGDNSALAKHLEQLLGGGPVPTGSGQLDDAPGGSSELAASAGAAAGARATLAGANGQQQSQLLAACLVTPLRQRATPPQGGSGRHSPVAGGQQLQESLTRGGTLQVLGRQRLQATPSDLSGAQMGAREAGSSGPLPVVCAVWALAMSQLDARQGQPRDPATYSALFEAPSSSGYLYEARPTSDLAGVEFKSELEPDEPDEVAPTTKGLDFTTEVARQLDANIETSRRTPSGPHEPPSAGWPPGAGSDSVAAVASSLPVRETLIRRALGQRRSSDESPTIIQDARSSNLVDEASQEASNSPLAGAQLKYSQLESSQGATSSNKHYFRPARDSPSSSQSQMKRFSSTSCLSNKPQGKQHGASQRLEADMETETQTETEAETGTGSAAFKPEEGTTADEWRAKSRGASRAPKKWPLAAPVAQKKSKSSKMSSGVIQTQLPLLIHPQCEAANLLASGDVDATVRYARQRRPSASNQGALNVDQQALFAAVECNQVEKAKSILEGAKVNVNSLNGDKLTCLDIAVLMRNIDMVQLLQRHGAKEGSAHLSCEARENQLFALYSEARRLVEDLASSLEVLQPGSCRGSLMTSQLLVPPGEPSAATPTPPSTSGGAQLMLATGSLLSNALLEEKRRQLQYWRRRLDLFMQMRLEFDQLRVPRAPELAVLQVVGEQSLAVKIVRSARTPNLGAQLAGTGADNLPNAAGQVLEALELAGSGSSLDTFRGLERKLDLSRHCAQGSKCSHWKLLESSGPQAAELWSSCQTAPKGGESNMSLAPGEQQQRRLMVFNQILAHQLSSLLLSQQEQPPDDLNEESSWLKQQQQQNRKSLMMANHQKASTESARCALAPSDLSLTREANQNCLSLAYSLMSGRQDLALAGSGRLAKFAGGKQAIGAHLAAAFFNRQQEQPEIVTKYRVEWSQNEQMQPVDGSLIVYNTTNCVPLECRIDGLLNGRPYFVCVSAGNHKGFSEPRPTTPTWLSASSWRQIDGSKRRKCDEEVFRKFTKLILLNRHLLDEHQTSLLLQGCQNHSDSSILQALGAASQSSKSSLIKMLLLDATTPTGSKPPTIKLDSSGELLEVKQPKSSSSSEASPSQASSLSVRKNLKSLFQSNTFKFHKLSNQNKRGVYLATVIYHQHQQQHQHHQHQHQHQQQQQHQEPTGSSQRATNSGDKIIVTNDERLPIVEVLNELVAPASLMSDFYWLLKINGAHWLDIKRLRQKLQKSHSSSTLHLRIKILAAIEQMQLALNTEDIGRLFYRPIQAHDGSILICTCKHVADTKSVSNLCIKWVQLHKIIPRHLRKISDSMTQQGQSAQLRPSSGGGERASSVVVLPATTVTQPTLRWPPEEAPDWAPANCQPQAGEWRPCELCQNLLGPRRSTMAGASSQTSLASSSTSQTGSGGDWSPSAGSPAFGGRCTCQRSASGASAGLLSVGGAGGVGGGGGGGGRAASLSQTSARTGSLFGTPTHGNSRHASAASAGAPTPTHKSPYLMLASLGLYDLLLFTLNEITHFDRCSRKQLGRGLYLGFVQLQTTVESMRLLVPRDRPNMVPCTRVRENSHVSRDEWLLLKRLATQTGSQAYCPTGSATVTSHTDSAACKSASQLVGSLPKTAQNRLSDPSIWVPEFGTSTSAPTPQPGGETNQLAVASDGFDRGRAKSVSPGLVGNQSKTGNHEVARPTASLMAQMIQSSRDLSLDKRHQPHKKDLSSGPIEGSPVAPATSTISYLNDDGQVNSSGCGLFQENKTTNASTGPSLSMSSSRELKIEPKEFEIDPINNDPSDTYRKCKQQKPGQSDQEGDFSVHPTEVQADKNSDLPEKQASSKCKSPTSASQLTVNSLTSSVQPPPEETFLRLVGNAAKRLLTELKFQLPRMYDYDSNEFVSFLQSLNDEENNRIYHVELIELNSQTSFILLIPSVENVCPVTSYDRSNVLSDNKDYMLLPLQIFETIHISTYEPDLLGKYSRLSAILETDLVVAQHDHRQAFSSNELKSTKSRVSSLQEMISIADEFWRQLRWIVDVVSFARDKSASTTGGDIKLGALWRHSDLSPSPSFENSVATTTTTTTTNILVDTLAYPVSSSHNQQGSNLDTSMQASRKAEGPGMGFKVASQSRIDQSAPLGTGSQPNSCEVKRTTSAHQPWTSSACQPQQSHSSKTITDCEASDKRSPEGHLTRLASATRRKFERQQSASALSSAQARRRHSGDLFRRPRAKDSLSSKVDLIRYNSREDDENSITGNRDYDNGRDYDEDDDKDEDAESRTEDTNYNDGQSGSSYDATEPSKSMEFGMIQCRPPGELDVICSTKIFIDGEPGSPTQAAPYDSPVHEDEEAIYAYHISLRDATKAAMQRKNSQQSTRVLLEDITGVTSTESQPQASENDDSANVRSGNRFYKETSQKVGVDSEEWQASERLINYGSSVDRLGTSINQPILRVNDDRNSWDGSTDNTSQATTSGTLVTSASTTTTRAGYARTDSQELSLSSQFSYPLDTNTNTDTLDCDELIRQAFEGSKVIDLHDLAQKSERLIRSQRYFKSTNPFLEDLDRT